MSKKPATSPPKVHISDIVMVPIAQLVPHPKNPNIHSKDQIERLAQIIEWQGWRYPVKVSNQSGFVTSGHGRIEAAKLRKWTEVPVSKQDYESEAQEYSDIVSDNAIAEWADLDLSSINRNVTDLGPDFDVDLLGIKNFTIEVAEKLPPESDEDELPGGSAESIAKPGDIWKLGHHRLMCGDCTDIMSVESLLEGQKIALMFTDPPYGINIVNVGTSAKVGFVGASAKVGFVGASNSPGQRARAREYRPIIGDDKDFDPNHLFALKCKVRIMWGANYYASKLPSQPQWLVWDKKPPAGGGLDHNNFSDCELAWTDAPGQAVLIYRHVWAGMLRQGSRKEEMTERCHPTQKPVGLCAQIIEEFSDKNESIIDVYGGSGSTLIACEKIDRKCYMMELDPHYVDTIIRRWEKYTGQKAELIVSDSQP